MMKPYSFHVNSMNNPCIIAKVFGDILGEKAPLKALALDENMVIHRHGVVVVRVKVLVCPMEDVV